jgi:hypothetical protein
MRIRILLGIAALLVAGCAAFFSVTGLGLLFHGASLSVMIMAGSLEFAKLVTASYLKIKWWDIGKFLKTYLTIAVITLMFLTSMGIFGFLSDAFQQQSIVIEKVDRQIGIINNKIALNKAEIERYNKQIVNFSQIRNSQENNISKMIDRQEGTSRMSAMIKNADAQIKLSSSKIDSLSDQNTKAYQEIDNVKNQNIDLEKQIGGFRFVADAFGIELKKAVKYFILMIVLVFDPLAIALVLAYNTTDVPMEETQEEEIEDEIEETEGKKRGRPLKKKLN